MKKLLFVALAAISLGSGYAQAKDIGEHVQSAGQAFDQDARQFGQSVKNIFKQGKKWNR